MTGPPANVVDLGCGNRKTPGAIGVDHHPGPDIDIVADLNARPWPLADSRFERIVCRHIIEHVTDVVLFMAEIHRIGKNGALVEITTPHFSSTNSWKDPTHLRHLSLGWYELFLDSGYLSAQTGVFEFVSTRLEFSSSIRSQLCRLVHGVMGDRRWEKYSAFRWPARDFETVLRVIK